MADRLRLGRLAIYIEPRDIWVGVYVSPDAVYVCLLPMLVLRWDRQRVRLGRLRLPPRAGAAGCPVCRTRPGHFHGEDCPQIRPEWWTEVHHRG